MKFLFLVVSVLLWVGCTQDKSENTNINLDEEIIEVPEIIKEKKYPTLESYVEQVSFVGDKKIEGDPYEVIYYDGKTGIQNMSIGNFYDTNKSQEDLLEEKRIELSQSRLIQQINAKERDEMYKLVWDRNQLPTRENGIYAIALKNKKLLESYKKRKLSKLSHQDLEQYIILAEEDADYERVRKVEAHKCKKHPESCQKINYHLKGWVKDDTLEPIQDATITILNDVDSTYGVNAQGEYDINLQVRPYQLVRILYRAPGVMPQIEEVRMGPLREVYTSEKNIRLPKAHQVLDLDSGDRKLETSIGNLYTWKKGVFKKQDGTVYEGPIKAYVYDFNPWEDDMGRALIGSLRILGGVVPSFALQSSGMPYVQFYTPSDEILEIYKNKPITVTAKIEKPQSTYISYKNAGENYAEFWERWKNFSEEQGAFTSEDIPEHSFVTYWVYDISQGLWEEVPMQVLDEGVVQSIFYTHH